MIKLFLLVFLFLSSLLVLFRAPASLLWYLAILVTEFCWVFVLLVCLLLFWPAGSHQYQVMCTIVGIAAILLFLLPYWQALQLSPVLEKEFAEAFPCRTPPEKEKPFGLGQVFTGILTKKYPYRVLKYDEDRQLHLNFYQAQKCRIRPCILVIHGGSWAAGDNNQLPDLNSILAKAGYHVASINYRLAPANRFPAPVEDVQRAIQFLTKHATGLLIDAGQFVLLGRSAGGQVALSAAYTLKDPAIKGVIDFYGPTDMMWGYQNPTNPLVLDSRKIMENYLGGSLHAVPDQYKKSSATATVTTHSPPSLLIYAERDPLVSPRHGNRLSKKLAANNIPHFAVYLPWATHAFDYTLNGPGGQVSTWAVKRFLAAILDQDI